MITKHYRLFGLHIVTILIGISIGCATDNAAKKDPFFEKWDVMAKTSEGHSPSPASKIIDIPEARYSGEQQADIAETKAQARKLPNMPVDLKMRDADIKAVLRSLARVAGINLLVKNDVKGDISVDFRGVPWDQVFTGIIRTYGLSYTLEENLVRVITANDLEQELKRKTQEVSVKLVEPLSTIMLSIDYANAKSLKDNLQEFLTKDKDGKPRGSVRIDEHSNSLIIQAIREDILKMFPIIEKIDKPTYQIKIKAHIVETTKDTARNLGIQWGGYRKYNTGEGNLYVTPGGIGTAPAGDPAAGGYTPLNQGQRGISGQGYGVNFPATLASGGVGSTLGLMFGHLGGNILDMQLSALQSNGKVNILSSPSITTLDNQKAFTESGKRVPVATKDKDGNITVRYEDAVLRLEIKPHVINGTDLKMDIVVKKDEVDPNTSNYILGNPPIYKKHTETTLIVQDGETIVISGLSIEQKSGSTAGVPLFKDIPFMGWLFKKEDKSDSMEEVLVFITPNILKPQSASAAPVKQEILSEN
ncbi:MAG: type IV pilus secretin PilQ [Syntrophaceae bacterium]|nr:type IV pilus secretin PilQ [Syntrophaceae bacterium]